MAPLCFAGTHCNQESVFGREATAVRQAGRYFGFGVVALLTLCAVAFGDSGRTAAPSAAIPSVSNAASTTETATAREPGTRQPSIDKEGGSDYYPVITIATAKARTLKIHVTDQDGYAIVGAWVSGLPDTPVAGSPGTVKKCTTDKTGNCTLERQDLESIVIAAPGFASKQIVPPSDSDAAEVVLHVATSASIQVSANHPAVSTEPSYQRGSEQSAEEIDRVPVWLRKLEDLVVIAPGVVPRPTEDDFGEGISSAGTRTTETNFVLDGGANRAERRGGVAIRPPLDAIAEVKILSSGYSAEYGGAPGAQVVMTTKSGSDRFHGDFYNYARDRMGGSLAGPIKWAKSYFFFSYEGANTNYGETVTASVPKSGWLSGQLQDYPGSIFLPTAKGTLSQKSAVTAIPGSLISPMAKTLSSLIPSSASGKFTSEGEHGADRILLLRLDRPIGAQSHVTLRAARQRTEQVLQPDMIAELAPYWPTHTDVSDSAVLSFSREHSHDALNLHAAYLDSTGSALSDCHYNAKFSVTLAGSSPTQGCPFIQIVGYQPFGDATEMYAYQDRHLDAGGDFSAVRGRNTIKVGAFVSNLRYAAKDPAAQNGRLKFDGSFTGAPIADFLLGMPALAQRDFTTMYKRGALRGTQFGTYVQNSLKVTKSFTLDTGVRFEYRPSMIGRSADFSGFSPALGAVQSGAQHELLGSQGLVIDPRIGFSWAPSGHRTVIRAGIGQYSGNELLSSVLGQVTGAADPRLTPSFAPQSLPVDPSAPTWTPVNISVTRGIDSRNLPVRIYQYSLTIEHEIRAGFVLEGSYIGSRGRHLGRLYNINMPLPTGALDAAGKPILARTYPLLGDIIYADQGASSRYDSATMAVRKRAAEGLHIALAYTFSKSIDDASSMGNLNWTGLQFAQDIRNFSGERGPSDFDHRHQLSGTVTFQPGRYWQSRIVRNSEVAVVVREMSGIRYTPIVGPYRADILSDPYANIPRGYFVNPAAFTRHVPTTAAPYYFGDAGRNSLIGPYFNSIDTAFNRSFSIKERCQLKIRMEVFNLLNRKVPFVANNLDDANFGKVRHYLNEGIHFVGGARISF